MSLDYNAEGPFIPSGLRAPRPMLDAAMSRKRITRDPKKDKRKPSPSGLRALRPMLDAAKGRERITRNPKKDKSKSRPSSP